MGDGRHFTSLKNAIHSYIKTIGSVKANIPLFGISDEDGNLVGQTNNQLDINVAGNLYVDDPLLTMAAGERVLLSRISCINKFGRNPSIDIATAPEDIWDGSGLWVPPTAARIHDIASSSANDSGAELSSGTADVGSGLTTLYDAAADFVSDGVAAGDTVLNLTNMDHATVISVDDLNTLTLHTARHDLGFNNGDSYKVVNPDSTGASIVHVFGLDSNMEEQEEFVILNGTSNVATVNTYWRIYRMHIDGADGRNVSNVGIITATAQTDATITAQISAGEGQTLMAIYPIPAGKTGYMTQFYSSITKVPPTTGGVVNMSIFEVPFASIDGSGSRKTHFFSLSLDGTSNYPHPFKPYKPFLAQTDIVMRCEGISVNNSLITGGFDIILVDN